MRDPFFQKLHGAFPTAIGFCAWTKATLFSLTQPSPLANPLFTRSGRIRVSESLPNERDSSWLDHGVHSSISSADLTYVIDRRVYRQIERTLGCHQPERGGLLGGCRSTRTITDFWHDNTPALADSSTYEPNLAAVNGVLKDWNARGIDLIGMVHSHPGYFGSPSSADCEYARKILQHNPAMKEFFMPIVLTRPATGSIRIRPYVVERASKAPFTRCKMSTTQRSDRSPGASPLDPPSSKRARRANRALSMVQLTDP